MKSATLLAKAVLLPISQSERAQVQVLLTHTIALIVVLLFAQVLATFGNLKWQMLTMMWCIYMPCMFGQQLTDQLRGQNCATASTPAEE